MAPAHELRGMGFLDALKTEAGLDSFSQHILLVQGSGRNWKEPSQRASSVKNPILTSSWEKKMQQKAAHQRYKEVKQAAIDVRKQKLQVCDMLGIAKCSDILLLSSIGLKASILACPAKGSPMLVLTPASRSCRSHEIAAVYRLGYAVLLHRVLALAMHRQELHGRRRHQPADTMRLTRSAGFCRQGIRQGLGHPLPGWMGW